MTKREVREAYRAFNRAARLQRDMDAADRLIVKLAERKLADLANKYQEDRAFLAVLRNYTGHSAYGWLCACGNDGRMKALVKNLGWKTLAEVIRRVRWRRYANKKHGPESSATVKIDITIGGMS